MTSDEKSFLVLHDVDINESIVYYGEETVNGNDVTITDSESGESFTFTVLDSANDAIQIETDDYGQVIMEECSAIDAAVDFFQVPFESFHWGANKEDLQAVADKIAQSEKQVA